MHTSTGGMVALVRRIALLVVCFLGSQEAVVGQTVSTGTPTGTPGPGSDETCPANNGTGPKGVAASYWTSFLDNGINVQASSFPAEVQASLYAVDGGVGRKLYSDSTVNTTGDLHYTFPLASATSFVGQPVTFGLHYRSDATLQSCDQLNENWHLDLVDKVILTGTQGSVTNVRWITGSGDVHDFGGGVTSTTPSGTEVWFKLPGKAYSQFRYYDSAGTWVLERYTPSGHVMRYAGIGGSTTNFRPSVYFDPFDNATTYAYDSSGILTSITDPRGLAIRFTWTSTSCSIVYDYPGTSLSALDRSFAIDATTKNVTSITYPASGYVEKTNSTDKLLNVGTTISDARVLSFAYSTSHGLLSTLTESRAAGAISRTLWSIVYASQGGRYRVTTATDVFGLTQYWTNRSFDTSNNLLSYRWTEPNTIGSSGTTTHDYSLDTQGRILTDKTSIGANGKPRADAGDSPSEPADLSWAYEYGTCSCLKPTKVTTPSGAEFTMTWDSDLNKILTLTKLSPTGSGTVTQTWTWRSFLEQGLPNTYVPPTGGASLTYSYDLINRSSGLAGKKIDYFKVETSTITHPDNSALKLVTETWLDTLGRPANWKDVGGTTFTAAYYTTGQTGYGFLKSVTRASGTASLELVTAYEVTNLGWLTRETVGTGSTMLDVSYTLDGIGRKVSISSSPGSSQPASIRELYRDRYGNVAVERKKNLNSQGTAQKHDDGTGSGRTWVRNEWHYDYDLITESYLDRRSLSDGEDFTNVDTGTNPWMVRYAYDYRTDDGTLNSVTLPNGSTNQFVVDGYGTLYKIIGDVGGTGLDLGRAYYDNDLMLAETRKRLTSTTTASWTVTRNHTGKGYPYKTQDPTGVITTVVYDALGRVTSSDMRNGTNPIRRKSEFEYDQVGRLTRQMAYMLNGSGAGSIVDDTKFVYTDRSQILRTEGVLGRKSFRTYDAVGRLLTAHDNRSTSTTDWDEVALEYMTGRDLVSKVTSKIWEDAGTASRKEYVTEYAHDLFGRVTQVQYKGLNTGQAGITRSYSYDTLGNLTGVTDPIGRPRTALFDADGRWIESVLKAGTGTTAPKITMTSSYSDKVSGSKATYRIRADGKGFTTREEFDALYRMARVERPGFTTGSAHRTELTYDSVSGRLTSLKDGNDSIVAQTFDAAGRLLQRDVTPGSGVSLLATKEKFDYDDIGVMNRMETDQQTSGSVFLGAVGLSTDSLNRLTKESFTYWGIDTNYPVEVTSGYTYTGSGGTADDPGFRRSLNYGGTNGSNLLVEMTPDSIGRLDTVKMTPAGGTGFDVASYKWAGSQPMQRLLKYGPGSTPHTQTTTFGYDAYRRLASISDLRDGQSTPYSAFAYEWDPAGNLLNEIYTKKQGDVGDRFDYDGFDRVIGAKLGAASMSGSYASASAAKEIAYTLDAGNSRSGVTETLSGLPPSSTSYATFADNYRYESLVGAGSATPYYDNEGNLVYDGRFYYVYDFKNRLSEVWLASAGTSSMSTQQRVSAAQQKNATSIRASKGSLLNTRKAVLDRFNGGLDIPIKNHKALQSQGLLEAQGTTQSSTTYTLSLIAVYGYDPMNRRIIRIVPGFVDHRYAYDRWREVEELTPNPGYSPPRPFALKDFVWGSRIDELICYRRQESIGTWVSYFPTQGKMDNVVALHRENDSTGVPVEVVEYDPYGKASVFVGTSTTPQDTSSVENPYLFQGRRLDWETGFLYFRNRYLHTGWGRFLTNDPIGTWGDAGNLGNGVAFVGNSPSLKSDPTGLTSLYDTGGSGAISEGASVGGGGWTCGTPQMPGSANSGGASGSGGGGAESSSNECDSEEDRPGIIRHNWRYYVAIAYSSGTRYLDVTDSLIDGNGDKIGGGEAPESGKASGGHSGWTPDGVPVVTGNDIGAGVAAAGGMNSLPTSLGTNFEDAYRALYYGIQIGGMLGGGLVAAKLVGKLIQSIRVAKKVGCCTIVRNTAQQLQRKFKHAKDFGINGNYTKSNAVEFSRAINKHINSESVKLINGTYRGEPAIHYLDPASGLDVITDLAGNFVSGWKLNPAQLLNVVNRGSL